MGHCRLWNACRSHIIVPMMVLRSACNNCCYPLQKSLLMDYVPKVPTSRHTFRACQVHIMLLTSGESRRRGGRGGGVQETRGRWNSLDSVLAFGWCGSAVAGGFLLDAYGFDSTFCITATFQVGGLFCSSQHKKTSGQQEWMERRGNSSACTCAHQDGRCLYIIAQVWV